MKPHIPLPLDAHVLATFVAVNPDRGSEHATGWNWLREISRVSRRVTAVVPWRAAQVLEQDPRLPDNVTLISPQEASRYAHAPLPRHYREYANFALGARKLTATIEADLAHQVNIATPYWGSSIADCRCPTIRGPVNISQPIPRWAWRDLQPIESLQELVRVGVLTLPRQLLLSDDSESTLDYLLAGDRLAVNRVGHRARHVLRMIPDGANPVPPGQVVPFGDRQHIVWAGRFLGRKGAMQAIRAFARARDELPHNTRLIMLGDGPQRERAAQLSRRLGLTSRVDLPGEVPRETALAAMATARALMFTSIRESFGGVVLEAAERATPAVIALHSGIVGLADSLPPGAAWTGYANSMSSMVDVLARGIGQAARSEEAEWSQKSHRAYEFATANSWVLRGTRLAHIYHALLVGEDPGAAW